MTTAQYITVRETAQMLGVSEKKIMDLVEEGKLQAYKIAGQFLRLKKSDVLNIRNTGNVAQETTQYAYTAAERIKDFFYFNDFYLVSTLLILFLLGIVFYF